MKNNYKQLKAKSPTGGHFSSNTFKRSASHALRSSFRLPAVKNHKRTSQFHALNLDQLPPSVPPKALRILQIDLPQTVDKLAMNASFTDPLKIKIATIRRRSVWANATAKISLPTGHEDDEKIIEASTKTKISEMHIGGFNFLQQNKATAAAAAENANDVVSGSAGILKESNKNTAAATSENFKVVKKYKNGHVNKSFEPSSAYALFECVEANQFEQLKILLEQKHLNVNALNDDGFSVLDLAVLLTNRQITKLLLQHGAQTGNFPVDNIEGHLSKLLADAEKKLSQIFASTSSSTSNTISVGLDSEKCIIERRIKLITTMINGWQRLRAPDPPFSFTIDVIGTNSVLIKILEPIEETICTTFRVQYSPREDFSIVIAEKTISEWNIFQGTMGVNFLIDSLVQRRRYYFRACSGNIKGYGSYKVSNPVSVVPSSWKDVEMSPRDSSFLTQRDILDNVLKSVQQTRTDEPSCDDQRRKKKHAIKHLFTGVSKFQKTLRRGIYLACIIFSDEKILVTNEDFIPVIEIDSDSYPSGASNFTADFYWLMKISTSWEDAKNLRVEMEKNTTSKIQFRFCILKAIHQMQLSLGITDLGQFYFKPLKDSNGTIVLSCALYVKEPKASTLHTRWVSMSKLQKKVTVLLEDSPINEILLNSIQSQISFYQASKVKLSRGLYLGYLKMFSSMDSIQIVCQAKTPNVLPNCKIRDNPHISAEEWTVIKSNLERDKEGKLSQAQENFIESLKLSLNRLFKFMNIDQEEALKHRIYDVEVVELNEDVSFLLVCPPTFDSIVSKDSSNASLDLSIKRSDLISLPLIAHEMIQFNTYQHSLLQKYARLSFLTEFDIATASLKQREAFSNNEMQIAKDKLKHLEETMSELNSVWKSVRWMTDVIAMYRSKEASKVDIKKILQFISSYNIFFKMPDTQLRGFHVRSPVRGSWAGPQTFRSSTAEAFLEHSKSEQLLNSIESQVASAVTSSSSSTVTTAPVDPNRKASIDSNYYSAGEQNEFTIPRLPTSKSEDTLVVTRKKIPLPVNSHQRKRPTSINPPGIPESSIGKSSNGLIVHRQPLSDPLTEIPKASSDSSPSKSKLRVSHHPKSTQNQQKKEIRKYHDEEEESTLVTFLKSTPEAHNNHRDPLIIVEDEAIEMISSPFRKTPLERSSKNSTSSKVFGKSLKQQQHQLQQQFLWSNLHRKNAQSICQASDNHQSVNWGAFDAFTEIKDSSEATTFNFSQTESSDIESEIKEMLIERDYVNHDAGSSILQIYAAYETGLSAGTSLKLKCCKHTTARELVDLVVKQLNMAVVMKGKDDPKIYGANQLEDFCLVAVIGARERCLRDDFMPLDLQHPWKKGKLFVRFKHDLLAAIESNTSNREAFSI